MERGGAAMTHRSDNNWMRDMHSSLDAQPHIDPEPFLTPREWMIAITSGSAFALALGALYLLWLGG